MPETTHLYGFPFSCSFAVSLVLAQHGVPHRRLGVARGEGRKVVPEDLAQVNPRRKVPTLVAPDGTLHREIVSILHHLDVAHVGRSDTGRREHLEWLSFLATELHQQVLGPVFDEATPTVAVKDVEARLLPPVLADLTMALSDEARLVRGVPSGAEAYLFWGLLLIRNRWPSKVEAPPLARFMEWMGGQPHVRSVLREEMEQLAKGY